MEVAGSPLRNQEEEEEEVREWLVEAIVNIVKGKCDSDSEADGPTQRNKELQEDVCGGNAVNDAAGDEWTMPVTAEEARELFELLSR